MLRWFFFVLCLVLCCFGGADSLQAQHTGGSFGGSSWSGGGGSSSWSGGGSSSWSGGSSSWGGSSGSTSYGSRGDSNPLALFVFLALFVIFHLVSRYKYPKRSYVAQRQRGASRTISVQRLNVAIDARARAFIQAQLDELARTHNPNTLTGLHALLSGTTNALLRSSVAWLYAGMDSSAFQAQHHAQARFSQIASDLRSRFRYETVRRAGDLQTRDAPSNLRAREEEGEGLVVVHLILASLGQPSARSIRDALVEAGSIQGGKLQALEVIWSPSKEEDRMSSAELEVLYPELYKLPDARAGRVFCTYCGGPFAAELPTCPHCGAPTESASATSLEFIKQ